MDENVNNSIVELDDNLINEIISDNLNIDAQSLVTENNNETSNDSPLTAEEQSILDKVIEEEHKEIPLNSDTLLIDEATSRFSSAIWYKNIQSKVITIAGIGGIGSFVVFLLSRLKPNALYIYDNDIVETVNMSGQLYSIRDININKVTAIAEMVRIYADFNNVFSIPEKFDENSQASDIMICGFDNMKARQNFFNKWKQHVLNKPEGTKNECLFIDGRLAAQEFQIFCIKGDDTYNITRYQKEYLFSDHLAEETVCSFKQTTFCANMIASYMVNMFVNFCANQCNPIIDMELPFFTYYNSENMLLKIEN